MPDFTDAESVCTLYGATSFRNQNPKDRVPPGNRCRVVDTYRSQFGVEVLVLFFEAQTLWVRANPRCIKPVDHVTHERAEHEHAS